MKKILMLALLAVAALAAPAMAVDTLELPISSQSVPVAILISSGVYDNATPATVRFSGMQGVLIDNPSTNTSTVHGHIGNCTSTNVHATNVLGPIEIPPSATGGFIGITEEQCLWLVSRSGQNENVTVQAVTQKR